MELVNNVVVTNLINENKVQITWDLSTNTNFTKYAIYRSACSYSTFVKIAEVPKTQNSYDDIPIEDMPINEWYYKVAQINEEGKEGPVPNEGALFTNYKAFDVPRIVGPFQTPLPTDQDMKFYFNEIRSRNLWLLQNDGEPMILLKRKYSGQVCPCIDDADGSDQCPEPLNKETPCYATGYLGGYYPAINIMIRRWNQPRTVPTNTVGFELDMQPTMWTIYSPTITEGDILIDGQNRRWEVNQTHNYHWRELRTHQTFQVTLKKITDIIYKIPIVSYKYWGDEYWGTGFYGNQLV